MQGAILPTDYDWYEFLRSRDRLTEVNFWRPSPRRGFRAVEFSPLIFKLKAPHHAICGFGIFARYNPLPVWLAWDCGAELSVVPLKERMAPATFIRHTGITIWTSVPSVITFLQRLRLLKADAFPTIRHSMFCGEPLTVDQVTCWQAAGRPPGRSRS